MNLSIISDYQMRLSLIKQIKLIIYGDCPEELLKMACALLYNRSTKEKESIKKYIISKGV
jgi:hypothetical protein